MHDPQTEEFHGPFDPRYRVFLQTITSIRPSLHRYCCRMTGSILDGEDLVQEALFHAYRELATFDSSRPIKPWLFRIAHNRCIDFLRRREVRENAERATILPESFDMTQPDAPVLIEAVELLVTALPAKERACVLLKDVLDYSLEEIAELVDSTVGGVKSALSRGREKLATLPARRPLLSAAKPELPKLLHLYVERFNKRDWQGLKELIRDDAQLRVADRFKGALADSPYFSTYERWPTPWRMALGRIDGEPTIIIHEWARDGWTPSSVVHVEILNDQIISIDDYFTCPWLLSAAISVDPGDPS